MAGSILVTGATGRLGRLIVRRLLQLGLPVRAFTRRPEVAASLFGPSVEIAAGDFDNAESLERAFTSVDRVVLLSPLGDRLARQQLAVVAAAEQAKVGRIVKISGSDWTIDPAGASIAGAAHAEVERRLAASDIPSVAIRPNAWMQVSLPAHIANIKAGRPLIAPYGEARVSYLDARDIAEVAIQQLLAPGLDRSPLVLTGGEALTISDIAALASRRVGRPISLAPTTISTASPPIGFEARAVVEFLALIRAGRAGAITETVGRLLQRPPRSVDAFLAEHLELVPA